MFRNERSQLSFPNGNILVEFIGFIRSGNSRAFPGHFPVPDIVIGVAVGSSTAHGIGSQLATVIIRVGMCQIGTGCVEIILFRHGTSQGVIGVINLGRIILTSRTQIIHFNDQVSLFFPCVPSLQRIGIVQRLQQTVIGIVAIGKRSCGFIEGNGGKPSGIIITQRRLQNSGIAVFQAVTAVPA